MPPQNVTIDNVSPLIQYSPPTAWVEGSQALDPATSQYILGTYTVSSSPGASATFNFSGTAIWLYGAKRFNHGTYTVTLDSEPPVSLSGLPLGGFDVFEQVLFGKQGLTPGPHTIVLTNTNSDSTRPYLDLDSIVWEADIGGDGGNAASTQFGNSDGSFLYQPSPSSWSVASENGVSVHAASDPSASVTFSFDGDAVGIYGPVGPAYGFYDIVLDGGAKMTFNATKQTPSAGQLLYYASGFGTEGNHTVRVSPNGPGQLVAVDFAMTYKTSNRQGATDVARPGLKHSTVTIIGLVAAIGTLLLFVILFLIYLHRRINRMPAEASSLDMVDDDMDKPEPETHRIIDFRAFRFPGRMLARRPPASDASWAPSSSVVLTTVISRGPPMSHVDDISPSVMGYGEPQPPPSSSTSSRRTTRSLPNPLTKAKAPVRY